MGQDDWSSRWKEIGPERRRKILRAIQRGEAVADVRDAPLAVELIDRKRFAERWSHGRTWFSLWHAVLLAGCGVPLAVVEGNVLLGAIPILLALHLLGLRAFLDRLEARASLARDKNEQLARLL